jgi:DNA-binding GntR family transcriptional regulator
MNLKSVKESVTEYIRKKIITGEFVAGQTINETALAARLSISRPPIREALRTLENECLIVSVPRKGTHVRKVSIKDLRDLYQVREMVECYAIELLKNKNIKKLPEVTSSLEAFSHLSIPDSDDTEQELIYLMASYDFHVKLVKSSGNELLTYWTNSMCSRLNRYQFIFFYASDFHINYQTDHQQIFDLIATGAYEKAQKSLRGHIYSTFESLQNEIFGNKIKAEGKKINKRKGE